MTIRDALKSPVFYVSSGYLAALLALVMQEAVRDGVVAPESFLSKALAATIIPVTALGPALAVFLAIRHLAHRSRVQESLISVVLAMPLLGLWGLAVQRSMVAA